MTNEVDELQTNLGTLMVQDPASFGIVVERNFELLRDLLLKGQSVDGTFISADGTPKTITVENGIVVSIV